MAEKEPWRVEGKEKIEDIISREEYEKLSEEEKLDVKMAIELRFHLNYPCGTTLATGQEIDLREDYMNMAKKEVTKMTLETAIQKLKEKIREFEPEHQ